MNIQSQLQPPPESYLAPLLGLRDYYADAVEKYEKLYRQASANLNHVEALLSNWSSNSNANDKLPTDEVIASVATASTLENLSSWHNDNVVEAEDNLVEPIDPEAKQTNNLEIDDSSRPSQNINLLTAVDEVVTATDTEEPLSVNSNNITESEVNLVEPTDYEVSQKNDLETSEPSSPDASEDDSPVSTKVVETLEETQQNSRKPSDIPMLGEYQSLNRTEAILKVLQKHAGTVCHIDFIVRSLYGQLEPDVFKVVKGRVQSTLTYGRESGKWSLVPGKPGCFTLDLKLLNSNRPSGSPKQGKNKNHKPDPRAKTNLIPMIGEFEGQFLINALTCLLQQNPLQVFNVTEVIKQLYGELDTSDFMEVKPKVLNELSRGHRTGRFSRVPNEIGLYTWDSKLLQQTSAG